MNSRLCCISGKLVDFSSIMPFCYIKWAVVDTRVSLGKRTVAGVEKAAVGSGGQGRWAAKFASPDGKNG